MARTRRRQDLAGQLREAIRASGFTRYRICKECDVDQGAMSRFMSGSAGVNLETAGRIAEFLGLELQPIRRKPKGGK